MPQNAEETGPPSIAQMQQFWLDQIEDVKRRYEAAPEPQTALARSLMPRRPEEVEVVRLAYQAEIQPFLEELLKLKDFAMLTMAMPASALKQRHPSGGVGRF